jgi:peptidyl-prolyl isomerase H (cyclophilin H)
LDGKHVVFGKVLDVASMNTVRMIESSLIGPNGRPKFPIIIEECGEL